MRKELLLLFFINPCSFVLRKQRVWEVIFCFSKNHFFLLFVICYDQCPKTFR